MQQVLDYLQTHHDRSISLTQLARIAGYSPCHFQRLCQQKFGLGPGKLNELIRLQRGYFLLSYRTWLPVTDVAFDSGYESPDSFSRAFKRVTGYTPTQFKAQQVTITPPLQSYLHQWNEENSTMSATSQVDFNAQINVVSLPELKVCAFRHTGHPARLNGSIQRFIGWRREHKLPPDQYRTFNFLHNDPTTVAPVAFCFDLACERPAKQVVLADDMRFDTIPAGRYASLKITGGEKVLEAAVNFITTDFIARHNEQAADFPVIVERLSFYPEVPYHRAQSHILLLLSK
ncbi:MAG: helix-turn-helix domain-containing protein [Pseudomonadota bacterium]|nr:helix-turn-helix domain-containing protein [Pseudomonadota bacterium]